jgi:hypothetical protein
VCNSCVCTESPLYKKEMHNDLTDLFADRQTNYQIAVVSAVESVAFASITSYIGDWPVLFRTA